MTASVFVLSGATLKATLTLEGPVAHYDVDDGLEIFKNAENFRSDGDGFLVYSEMVDFEHLAPPPPLADDDEMSNGRENDDEVDNTPIDPSDVDAVKKRRERRERQRERFLAAKAKRDQLKLDRLKKIRQDGDPFQYTATAPADGWYRMCVGATWSLVSITMKYAAWVIFLFANIFRF